jgi:hypothetical protein
MYKVVKSLVTQFNISTVLLYLSIKKKVFLTISFQTLNVKEASLQRLHS